MPIPSTAKWPKPRSEDEFEDIAVDFLRIRWNDPNAVRNGRRGQRQHGVDITGRPSWAQGRTAGAQCKNVELLSLKAVLAEVELAKNFPGGLVEFKIITAAERDAELQAEVRSHFRENPAGFDVEVVFWPDVVGDLSADDRLVAKHWKGFSSGDSGQWKPPSPVLASLDVPDAAMHSEWQYEMAIWPSDRATIDASELAFEVEALARQGVADPLGSVLVRQPARTGEGEIRWSFEHKPYLNIRNRWELEVRADGFLAFRWAEWTHGTDRWCPMLSFVDGVLRPILLHRGAVDQILAKADVGLSTRFNARLTAHGDGPLRLNDDVSLTVPSRRVSAPESSPEWSVECTGDHSGDALANSMRLLNRAFAKFTFTTLGQHFGRNEESRFLRIDEAKFRQLYGDAALRG
jgi:hypothetical protein